MDIYIDLASFSDYIELSIFRSILDFYQISYYAMDEQCLCLFPSLLSTGNSITIKILQNQWEFANSLFISFKYDNQLKVV